MKRAGPVEQDVRRSPAPGALDGHLDTRPAGSQSPELRGTPVAEKRSIAACENGGHQTAAHREHRVPDGVDAAVNGVQAGGREPVFDEAPIDTLRQQLVPRNHAVLAAGKLRDDRVRWLTFDTHFVVKVIRPRCSPPSLANTA